MELVFATHNQNKLEEVQAILPKTIKLLSLDDIGCDEEIAETGRTLAENAKIKADHVTRTYGLDCFSDDTGLLIDALDGAPGVFSARYAGNQKNAKDNIAKVLNELQEVDSRTARFKTIIHLNLKGTSYAFEGVVEGWITKSEEGSGGFGYDPIFRPYGYDKTFGELPASVKNSMSHRGKAIKALVEFLKKEAI